MSKHKTNINATNTYSHKLIAINVFENNTFENNTFENNTFENNTFENKLKRYKCI